jgi:hypothetical protein
VDLRANWCSACTVPTPHLRRSSLAPRNRFCPATDQCARAHPPFYLLEAFVSERPFARPQRELVSELPFRGQCSWPTYSISTGPLPNPLQSDVLECPASLRSPPGVFMPFGIKAFSQFSLPEVHLHKMPVFPSLPVAGLQINGGGRGSMFQVR